MDKHFMIYGKEDCVWCTAALKLLDEKEAYYDYINLGDSPEAKQFIIDSSFKTVPQIFVNGQRIGGYQDLVEYFKG